MRPGDRHPGGPGDRVLRMAAGTFTEVAPQPVPAAQPVPAPQPGALARIELVTNADRTSEPAALVVRHVPLSQVDQNLREALASGWSVRSVVPLDANADAAPNTITER